MGNVFSLEQVAVVLGITVEEVEELLVKMKVIVSADTLSVCDVSGYIIETFVRFKSHTEVNLFVTVLGFKALMKEVCNVQ